MSPPKKYHSASKTFDKSQLFCSWQLQIGERCANRIL